MCDSAMAIQEIYKILIQDGTISDQKKEQLTQDYPCHTSEEQAAFLRLFFALEWNGHLLKGTLPPKNCLLPEHCLR